jgi:hypothetical protein
MQHPEWRLAGPNRFARTLAAELEVGRSTVILLPTTGFPDGLQASIREALPEIEVNRLGLDEMLMERGRIVDVLHRRLALGPLSPGDQIGVSSLARHPELRRRLIWIDGRSASAAQIDSWVDFLEQYTAVASEIPIHDRTVFATLCEGCHAQRIPDSMMLLVKRWWWRVVTPLDTEVFVAELAGGRGWKPAFVEAATEVAGFDLALAGILVQDWDGALSSLRPLLREHGLDRRAGDWQWSPRPSPRAQPPPDSVTAWSAGIVNAWGDRDPRVHACQAAAESPNALQHLIWLGQVRSLMPRIEIERQALAEWVYERRNLLPQGWRGKEIRSLEVVDLATIFRFPAFQKHQSRAHLARWLHRTRNAIAHLDILDVGELEQARQMLRPRAMP